MANLQDSYYNRVRLLVWPRFFAPEIYLSEWKFSKRSLASISKSYHENKIST